MASEFYQSTAAVSASLKDYPPWLVAACATIVAAAAIWVIAKLLKWALWALLVCVLVAGAAAVVALLVR